MILPTARLYWDDRDLFEFEATVVEVRPSPSGEAALVLDRTAFYPEGGGQPDDLGRLAGHDVLAVAEEAGEVIVHRLAAEGDEFPRPGDRVRGLVDAARRRDHRQQHSAQHLLTAILSARFGAETVSFHLGPETSTIDLDAELDDAQLRQVEEEALERIEAGIAVTALILGGEEIVGAGLRKAPPAGVSMIRVLEIAGLDRTPCGGTHVENTRELRRISIVGRERKKGGQRVTFVAGDRAVRLDRERAESLRAAAALVDAAPREVPARVRSLLDEVKELRREAGRLRERLATGDADRLVAAAGEGAVTAKVAEGLEEAVRLAGLVAERGRVAALVAMAPASPGLVVASPDPTLSAVAIASLVAKPRALRGGGTPRFARFAANTPAELEGVLEALGETLAPAGGGSDNPSGTQEKE